MENVVIVKPEGHLLYHFYISFWKWTKNDIVEISKWWISFYQSLNGGYHFSLFYDKSFVFLIQNYLEFTSFFSSTCYIFIQKFCNKNETFCSKPTIFVSNVLLDGVSNLGTFYSEQTKNSIWEVNKIYCNYTSVQGEWICSA